MTDIQKEFEKLVGYSTGAKLALIEMDNQNTDETDLDTQNLWDWIETQLKKAYIEGSNDCHKSLSSCAGVSLASDSKEAVLLAEIIEILGWNGGTIHQVKEEIKKLIEIKRMQGLYKNALTKAVTLPKGQLPDDEQYHTCYMSGTVQVFRNNR